ncbi:MAG TPA: AI-2E family transporter [Acidobacteriota bacterium]|jgi:predicted PurR-regulated permease PerM
MDKASARWFLVAVFLVLFYFCIRILQPFWMPVFLALIFATLLYPLYSYLERKWNHRRNFSALTICAGLTLVLLIPLLFLLIALAHEALGMYNSLQNPETSKQWSQWLSFDQNPILQRLERWLPGAWRFRDLHLGEKLQNQAQHLGVVGLEMILSFVGGLFGFLMNYLIMLTTLFFVLRDGEYFAERVRSISPLPAKYERMFAEKFRIIAQATVIGNLLTAVAQGAAGGLVFVALRLPNPILWGALTALFSLVPVVGTALIWVPWALYLFAVGSTWKGILLIALESIFVGTIDNFLRPHLMEGQMHMHTLLVFFSIIGGVSYFGVAGLLFGPIVVAITLTFVEIYALEFSKGDG